MKTLATKVLLPILAILFASLGAVASVKSKSTTSTLNVQGWKRVGPFNCVEAIQCNNIGSILCKDGSEQMYGKADATSDCNILLTHRP